MTYPKPKFSIGDKVTVDDSSEARLSDAKLFRKNGKVEWSYELSNTELSGFWAEERRIKLL